MELTNGLTPKQAAAESGLHIETVRDLCRSGEIKAQKVLDRAWLIDRAEIAGLKERSLADRLRRGHSTTGA